MTSTAVSTVVSPAPSSVERAKTKELKDLTTEKARRLIEPMLKNGVTYERVLSECYFAIQKNPKLMECTGESMIMAVAQCAAWDLEIGVKAHLVPFNVKVKVPDGRGGEKEEWQSRCQAIRDYKGDAELVIRCGAARSVDAYNVYSNETFEYELGSAPFIRHRPILDPGKRGQLIASYAVARVGTHDVKIIVLSRDEVDEVRRNHSKQWKTHWVKGQQVEWTLEEIPWYGPKTCVHRVVKLLPTNARLATLIKEMESEDAITAGPVVDLGPVNANRQIEGPRGDSEDSETSEAAGSSDGGVAGGDQHGREAQPLEPAPSHSSQPATAQQKERIAYLLNDPRLDLADEERKRIAKVAGQKAYTFAAAAEQITQLERLQSDETTDEDEPA